MNKPVGTRERTRFAGPATGAEIVDRSRLDAAYRGAVGCVLRILAPGGYGKSTLITRWLADEHRHIVWVDLERIDNDPIVLMNELARRLPGLGDDGVDELPDRLRERGSLRDVFVPAFGHQVRDCTTPFVMVLDDIHLVDEPQATAVIDAVAANLPAASTLVLAGRTHHHDDAFAAIRLRPGLVELDATDLAFDITETEQMMKTAGFTLDLTTLTTLHAEFDGWPAGLRLAALDTQANGGHRNGHPTFRGGAESVVDYFATQWIAELDADDRRFLLELACLGRFTSEKCDVVLQRQDSSASIRRLRNAQLLRLVPLDRRAQWYRMYPLLASWLSSELRSRDRSRWLEIHRAASAWWVEAGDIDLAFNHAACIGDMDVCESLAAEHGGIYVTRGMSSTVDRWMTNLGDERVRSSPKLCAIAAVSASHKPDSDKMLKWTRALSVAVANSSAGDADQTRLRSEILTASYESRPAAELVAGCEHAYAHTGPGPWRAFAGWSLGGLYFLMGDPRATDRLSEAAFEAEVANAPVLRANALATCAIVYDLLGERDRARELWHDARSHLHPFLLETLPTTAIASAIHALCEMRAGHNSVAEAAIRSSRKHLSGYSDNTPWFNVLARLPLARAALIGGDPRTGRELLAEIEHHLRFEPHPNGATAHVEALRADLEAVGPWTVGGPSLTGAELGVLQYLPTNLSLADIAARLFVSRNTVKSHTAAIYRKLGAASRTDAVDVARRWGHLDPE